MAKFITVFFGGTVHICVAVISNFIHKRQYFTKLLRTHNSIQNTSHHIFTFSKSLLDRIGCLWKSFY